MNASLEQAAAYFGKGDAGRARQLVTEVLAKEPLNGDAWHMRGVMALHTNRPADAVSDLTRAAELLTRDASIHINLGAALITVGRNDDALHVLENALKLDPKSPEAHFQLGLCHMQSNRRPEAIAAFAQSADLKPGWAIPLEMEANLLFHDGQHEKSFEVATRALEIDANRAVCHRIIADFLVRRLRYDEALASYRRAVALGPNDDTIRNNFALLLMRMGREEEGLAEYAVAYKLRPSAVATREGYGFGMLGFGHFSEGWLHYAARDKGKTSTFALRNGAPPPTDIAQVKGKSVLAWLNQGIGDQIMFASLIPDLIAAGATLTVECDARLVPVLERSFPTIRVRPPALVLPAPGDEQFSYQVFLPDAARWLRKSFDEFPRQQGYLKADPALTARLREAYRARAPGKPVIGISWRTATNAKISQQKSVELGEWGPLLTGRDAVFVKLQYGDLKKEVADASRKLGVAIIDDPSIDAVADIDAFAAQVAAVDLVITTSNATAHMAGSLNVPVWTLVPKGFGSMWHWFRNRDDSPWYPSMRLFRQSDRSAWAPVLNDVGAALTTFLASWKA